MESQTLVLDNNALHALYLSSPSPQFVNTKILVSEMNDNVMKSLDNNPLCSSCSIFQDDIETCCIDIVREMDKEDLCNPSIIWAFDPHFTTPEELFSCHCSNGLSRAQKHTLLIAKKYDGILVTEDQTMINNAQLLNITTVFTSQFVADYRSNNT